MANSPKKPKKFSPYLLAPGAELIECIAKISDAEIERIQNEIEESTARLKKWKDLRNHPSIVICRRDADGEYWAAD